MKPNLSFCTLFRVVGPQRLRLKTSEAVKKSLKLRLTSISTFLGNVTHINYLLKAREDRLKLIEGDPVSFSDVLGLLDEYEG